MTDLFASIRAEKEVIRDGVTLLPSFCDGREILGIVRDIVAVAPFTHMKTPGGRRMSVAITNCGAVGWISDHKGYRYSATYPDSDRPWPEMPEILMNLAQKAAEKGGFKGYHPDSCLINRYDDKASLSPHQDINEQSFDWPIVSVSLGRSAVFQLYGNKRGGSPVNIRLDDGDVLVFGGPSRMSYHGVRRLLPDGPDHMNEHRINLTFRRALA
ncbi:MAG: alpha-ketoglutarate-dependent dioxygenase AlkB [Emcibacter sp.]|nr:alpha-ketoglutarate-dependent dioxygenase AlkB [Emcibacter sp.]